jgi:hypothetical protein
MWTETAPHRCGAGLVLALAGPAGTWPLREAPQMHHTPKVTDARLADAIRVPVADAAEHAGLGDPGMAFAMRGAVPGPRAGARVGAEAALRLGRVGIPGETGGFVGMEGYGALAPAPTLRRNFGITPKTAADRARAQLSGRA